MPVLSNRNLSVRYGPWDGGLNLRDHFAEIAPNELAEGTSNFTLDSRGVASKRNDCPLTTLFPQLPGNTVASHYSRALNLLLIQFGTNLYKAAPGAAGWTLFRSGVSGTARFVDFAGKVVYTENTTHYYDGTTDTLSSNLAGDAIAVWQNKVWIAHHAVDATLYWSDAGLPTGFGNPANKNSLREKDDKPITALFSAGGGLVAFKEDSAYRINDSTSGSYSTIDWTTGAVGARAVTGLDGLIYVWSKSGLYAGDGVGRFRNVGDRVKPLYARQTDKREQINAVTLNNRAYFSFASEIPSITLAPELRPKNNSILEYDPAAGWVMTSLLGASVNITSLTKYEDVNGVEYGLSTSDTSELRELFTGGDTSFSSALYTGYIEPALGRAVRAQTLRPQIYGTSNVTLGLDVLEQGGSESAWSGTLPLTTTLNVPPAYPRRVGRTFQVRISEAGGATLTVSSVGLDATLLEN